MTVTADISPRSSPTESATLHFLTGFGAETTLPMTGGSGMNLHTQAAARYTICCASYNGPASNAPAWGCVKETC